MNIVDRIESFIAENYEQLQKADHLLLMLTEEGLEEFSHNVCYEADVSPSRDHDKIIPNKIGAVTRSGWFRFAGLYLLVGLNPKNEEKFVIISPDSYRS